MRHLLQARLAPARLAFPSHTRNTPVRNMHNTSTAQGAKDRDDDLARERIPTGAQPSLNSANADQMRGASDRERFDKSFVEAERNATRDAGKDAGKMNSAEVNQAVRDDERK